MHAVTAAAHQLMQPTWTLPDVCCSRLTTVLASCSDIHVQDCCSVLLHPSAGSAAVLHAAREDSALRAASSRYLDGPCSAHKTQLLALEVVTPVAIIEFESAKI